MGQSWPCPESAKKKLSEAFSGRKMSKSWRSKISKALKGKLHGPMSEERKKKFAEIWRGRKHTLATRKKMRQSAILRMENNSGPWVDTKPEREVEDLLRQLNVKHEHPKRIEGYLVDFYIPSSKTVIEVDGCYWHGCPKHCPKRRNFSKKGDQRKNRIWRKAGYRVIRVWEHDTSKIVEKLL